MSINQQHPELLAGEIFLVNATAAAYDKISWKTKRMGQQAYDPYNRTIPADRKIFPVFMQKSERDKTEATQMANAPESYINCRRPPLLEALALEGDVSFVEATGSLISKGYFTPPPRPWHLGAHDRGMDRQDWAVLDKFGDLVVETKDRETAEFIISAVNTYSE